MRYGSVHRHERVLDLRAGALAREVEWSSPGGQAVRCAASGWSRSPSGRSRRSATRSSRSTSPPGSSCSPSSWPTSSCPRRTATTRASRRRCARRWSPSSTAATTSGVTLIHRTRHSGLRWPRRWTTRSTAPRARRSTSESQRGPRRAPRSSAELQPGAALRMVKYLAYGWSAQRSVPAVRDQVGAALRPRATPAGTGCSPSSARSSTTSGTRADVEIDGDPQLQQAVRFALFHVLQAGRAGRAAGDPGQGADRSAATTATRSGTPRPSCCRCSPTPCPTRRRDALRWRHSTLDLAQERAAAARACAARRSLADDPRPGVLGLLAGRHGGVPHQRRHRRRGRAATSPPPATRTFEREVGLELLVETARLWRSLGPPRRGAAASASTASPAGRVHARSSTTTSSPT